MERNTKTLGGVGHILILASMVLLFMAPGINFIVAIAGLLLALIAYANAARTFNDPLIKRRVIKAVILYVLAIAVIIVGLGASLAALSQAGQTSSPEAIQGAESVITPKMVPAIIIALGLTIASSFLWYKANVDLTKYTGVKLFKTGGLLLFVGSTLLIVLAVGALLMIVGYILLTIAFFNVKEVEASR